ncbi:hypothetical protein SMICM304S_02331 [Streptomyces microflavus]
MERQFLPYTGQVLNTQYAVGVWAASEAGSFPVNWRLHLFPTPGWRTVPAGRRRIHADAVASRSRRPTAFHEAYLGMMRSWGLRTAQVVLDGHGADAADAGGDRAGLPRGGRTGCWPGTGGTRLDVTDPLLRGRDQGIDRAPDHGDRPGPAPAGGLARPRAGAPVTAGAWSRRSGPRYRARCGRRAGGRGELKLRGGRAGRA